MKQTKIEADTIFNSDITESSYDIIVLPGGSDGAKSLAESEDLINMLK